MTQEFNINALLHSIIKVHRANNEIIFKSSDFLSPEFRALQSKRLLLTIREPNGYITQPTLPETEPAKLERSELITMIGPPVPKPRQTVSDKWELRDCVVKYRAYADNLRKAARGKIPRFIEKMTLVFYIKLPESYSHTKRLQLDGQPHQEKPDIDNLTKSAMDALIENDEIIPEISAKKVWTLGEPKTEIYFN